MRRRKVVALMFVLAPGCGRHSEPEPLPPPRTLLESEALPFTIVAQAEVPASGSGPWSWIGDLFPWALDEKIVIKAEGLQAGHWSGTRSEQLWASNSASESVPLREIMDSVGIRHCTDAEGARHVVGVVGPSVAADSVIFWHQLYSYMGRAWYFGARQAYAESCDELLAALPSPEAWLVDYYEDRDDKENACRYLRNLTPTLPPEIDCPETVSP